jgi:23S rRNA (uridine2552-2'-O)-methyltransferase
MGRSKSSHRWLKEHFDDEYVKRAQKEGYRSRSVYKLIEIQEKTKLLHSPMNIVELGCAPGGWTEYAAKLVGSRGIFIAVDLLNIDPVANVEFIQGDFTEQAVLDQILEKLENQKVDLVMSDMAPNISGMASVDQPRAMYLAELALDLSYKVLNEGGSFLVKLFQGEGFDELTKEVKSRFAQVKFIKPKASRPRSREVYLLATGYKGVKKEQN